jgi:ATPase subunit of ABC transporter with duplicated ATPase domains
VIVANAIELTAGARTLLEAASFRVAAGDRIGLVGRNGAGKTTLLKVLAGEGEAESGTVLRSGTVGYLPQDPRTGDLDVLAKDRILSGRKLDKLLRDMHDAAEAMGSPDHEQSTSAIERYGQLEERFQGLGGYAAEAEAAAIASSLRLPDRVLHQPLRTLSGGQRRRVELARVLFSGAATLLLDEPTNHLDADSVGWLRNFLKGYAGGLVLISHDVSLIEATVTRVFNLDATRAHLDVYNLGWKAYLLQRDADEQRRRRERNTAERQAVVLKAQADKMRYKATKAKAAQNMDRRAERLLSGLADVRRVGRVAKLRFPDPAPCGRLPLVARGLSKSFGSLEVFNGIDLEIQRGSRTVILGLNAAGKTTMLRLLAGVDTPETGTIVQGFGLRLGYYAQEHELLDPKHTLLQNLRSVAPDATEAGLRGILGSFLFSGETVRQLAGTLSGGEKTRLALAMLVVSNANVLLLDEPTNNLDPPSREQVLSALRSYRGAIVLVTHDEGAVEALQPDRLMLMPDGILENWSADFADLVAVA